MTEVSRKDIKKLRRKCNDTKVYDKPEKCEKNRQKGEEKNAILQSQ